MLKKIMFGIAIAILLVPAENLIAQQASGAAGGRPMQGQRGGMRRAGQGMGPGQDRPGFMRGGLQAWLDQLEEAYKQNDREKTGELIAQMRQRMEGMPEGTGRPGRGGPPQGAGVPGRGFRPGDPGGPQRPTEPARAGTPDRAMRPGQGRFAPGSAGTSFLESPPAPKTDTEKKILAVLDDMDKNQRRGMMNVAPEDGRLLRLLAETVGAKHIVEVGTSNGYSGIWFSLALQKTGGKLTTHEIDARRASLARQNFKQAGVDKLVTLVEGDAHQEVAKLKGPIDILFLDADKEGYVDYLNKLLPLVRPGGLIVAHNMTARMADPRYVTAITTNPDLETILLHQQGSGVSVTLKKR
jgi:caffeoyl-CoA O-methyltransferase